MFTIKHITVEGNEELHSGTSPIFVNPNSFEGKERGNAVVRYTDEKGTSQTIRWGKVYVMNGTGQTVATYEMGSPNVGMSFGSGIQTPEGQERFRNQALTGV